MFWSAETKKELMSLGHFGMRNHLELLKHDKTVSKEGTEHIARDEATVPEIETAEGGDDAYLPEPGLLTLKELHKVMGCANTNVTM